MSKIVTLEEYKGTFLEKCYTSEPVNFKKIFDTLNNNLEKSLIDLDLYDKSMSQLDSVLEKAKTNKYIKRTGTPGNYKYEYADGDGKTHERAMTNTLNEKVGVKGGDFSENKVKKEESVDSQIRKIGESGKFPSDEEIKKLADKGWKGNVDKVKEAIRTSIEAHKTSDSTKPKHISDMSKEEKHSMAEKMGISGHREMTEKELSKQLIERKIDNELKGGNKNLTESGKKIFDDKSAGNKVYEGFSRNDHIDAAEYHTKKNKEFADKVDSIREKVPGLDKYNVTDFQAYKKWSIDNPEKSKELEKLGELMSNHANKAVSHENKSIKMYKEDKSIKKSFEDNINILKGEQLEGGLGDNLSVEDIAKKHKVSKETIENQLEIGIKVEMEHTNDKLKAKEIVLDHLTETSDYYTKLREMEKK